MQVHKPWYKIVPWTNFRGSVDQRWRTWEEYMQNLNAKDCRRAWKGMTGNEGQYEHRNEVCHKILGNQIPLIPTTRKNIE